MDHEVPSRESGHVVSPLIVLHHSANYLVLDKHHDILINSDPTDQNLTVQKQLKSSFPHLSSSELKHEFRFAHRLDYSTSGALCIALTKCAAREAMKAFASRRTHKYYVALLRGHVSQEKLDIEIGIGEDTRQECRHRMCTADKTYCTGARSALTKLWVLQLGYYDNEPATKVLLKPVTGRRHQLRVHCHHIGHTVVGDYTYSDKMDTLPHRMFLHSYHLLIPTSLELIDVQTTDPFLETDEKNKWKVLKTINTYEHGRHLEFL